MKTYIKQKLFGGILFGFGIILSVLGVGIIYSSWSGYNDLPNTNAGSGLTNTMWNNMVAMINKSVKQDSEIISVDNTNQRIGIGTNAPSTKLEVNGKIKISDGTQGLGKTLTSDTNGIASWSDPSYQFVTLNLTSGTVVNSSNDLVSTSGVDLTSGIRLLNIGYYLYPSAISGCFDIHLDSSTVSGTTNILGTLPNVNSETSYTAGRHSYITTTQLLKITSSSANIQARRWSSWCGGANYTIASSTLSMIATKIK